MKVITMKTSTNSPASCWKRGLKSLAATIALLLFTGLAAERARAQSVPSASSCQSIIQGHVDWIKAGDPGTRGLQFVLVSNALRKSIFFGAEPNQVATYAEGGLGLFVFGNYNSLQGEGAQYFNNRLWHFPVDFASHPFDPGDTDDLTLAIGPNGSANLSKPGTTWTDTVQLQCDKGVMYGFGKLPSFFSSGAPYYAITLKRVELAPPPQ